MKNLKCLAELDIFDWDFVLIAITNISKLLSLTEI